MARMARVVVEGVPHHVTQRGNNRRDVFLLDEDRRLYLETLKAKCEEHGVTLLGYCLMTNHVHLIAVPESGASLARALGQCHCRYACGFNRRYDRSGHLWQNRFYSSPLGESHLVAALAYVDLNPVRAGLVGAAETYPWSSARAHLGEGETEGLIEQWSFGRLRYGPDWQDALAREGTPEAAERLRRATYSGLPFGDDAFVNAMEKRVGRSLRPQRPGRKPKAAKAAAG